jgi:hypothetical protein
MPYSTLITLPNLHIASPLAIQNWKKKKKQTKKKKQIEKQQDKLFFCGMYDSI